MKTYVITGSEYYVRILKKRHFFTKSYMLELYGVSDKPIRFDGSEYMCEKTHNVNSILFKLNEENKYLYIGYNKIFTFFLNNNIKKFNNLDQICPFIIDSKDNYILLEVNYILFSPNKSFAFGKDIYRYCDILLDNSNKNIITYDVEIISNKKIIKNL